MNRRQLVKDVIAHKATVRAPYGIDFTRKARETFERETGCRSADAFLDNDKEVRTEARRVRDLMSADGGYILSPAQQLQDDVPVENILALIDVAKNG